jgi:hypothetical protein
MDHGRRVFIELGKICLPLSEKSQNRLVLNVPLRKESLGQK